MLRYSPNGVDPETMIEDAAIDIVADMDWDESTTYAHPGDLKEFAWRGWNWKTLKSVAHSYLRGDKIPLGVGYVKVVEMYATFYEHPEDGWLFDFDDAKTKVTESS